MTVNLSDDDIEAIVKILDGWPAGKKLTWDNLIDSIQIRLYRKYSRQALPRHTRIKQAYAKRKDELRYGSATPEVKSVELQRALDRIEKLKNENSRLKAENTALLEQFARWSYNAHNKGLSIDYLNQPLEPVDRGKTES